MHHGPAAANMTSGPHRQPGSAGLPTAAVLLMTRVRPSAVPWAMGRLVRGPGALKGTPGLRFARVLGSGWRGGFGLKPGLDCQGLFALFDTAQQATHFASQSPCVQAYQARAVEGFTAVLEASSARGSWAGQGMAVSAAMPAPGVPVAALTRASIRPSKAARFWRQSPAAEHELAQSAGCRLAVGLGEAPVLRQATFSLWDNQAAMDAYARQGSHQAAIRASYAGEFFSEWMFVRFVPLALSGSWQGHALSGVALG